MKPLSLLMLKLGGIGDIVTTTPAFRSLRKSFPDAWLVLCAEKTPAELVSRSPWFDEILIFDDLYRCQKYAQFLTPPFLKRIVEFVHQVRKRRYDQYLDFHDLYYPSSVFKPWLVGLASGAKKKIGLDTDGRGFFLDHRIPTKTYGFDHMIDRSLRVAEAAGAKPDGRQTEICLGEEDRQFARDFFSQSRLAGQSHVFCIHPGANIDFPLKFWPVEKFLTVARHLLRRFGGKVLLIGAKSDQLLTLAMKEALGDQAADCAGKTTVRQLGALMEQCDFYLGADTGPLHMALALRLPSVGIFGPGNYPAYGTYGAGYEFYHPIWHQVPEFPWTKTTKVKGNPYMDAVTVEEVMAACEKQVGAFVLTGRKEERGERREK